MEERTADIDGEQLRRVRRICASLPGTSEKISHGEPTFFIGKKVFAVFANNHHNDGRVAVWVPVEAGSQDGLINSSPKTFFRPPYVGVRGWVGIELDQISHEDLAYYLRQAWRLIAPKRLRADL